MASQLRLVRDHHEPTEAHRGHDEWQLAEQRPAAGVVPEIDVYRPPPPHSLVLLQSGQAPEQHAEDDQLEGGARHLVPSAVDRVPRGLIRELPAEEAAEAADQEAERAGGREVKEPLRLTEQDEREHRQKQGAVAADAEPGSEALPVEWPQQAVAAECWPKQHILHEWGG